MLRRSPRRTPTERAHAKQMRALDAEARRLQRSFAAARAEAERRAFWLRLGCPVAPTAQER